MSDPTSILDDDLLTEPSSEEEAIAKAMSYQPTKEGETKASKILKNDPDYDSDGDKRAAQKSIERQLENFSLPPLPEQKPPNYEEILKRMDQGTVFYSVKNVSNIDLVIDWDRTLMPSDMHAEFLKYLEAKYIQNGLEKLIGKAILTAIYKNHRTIDFLQGFVNERQYPTLLPRVVGDTVETKSQFVILSGETVIVTEPQLESLRKYQKIKMKYSKAKNDGDMFTSWLGFLIFEQLDKKMVRDIKRSYVSIRDVYNSAVRLETSKINKVKKLGMRHSATVIEATE